MSMKRKALQKNYKPQKQRDIVLILTNGKNAEKHYFKSLTAHFESIFRIQVKFANGDVLHLVEDAIDEKARNKELNQVWCVFDIDDSFAEGKIEEAFRLARQEDVKMAYSNEAFEVWLLFHYLKAEEIGQVHRAEYKKKMNKLLKEIRAKDDYSKDNSTAQTIADKFVPNYKTAVTNAQVAYAHKRAEQATLAAIPPVWEWLTTSTVFKLIEELQLRSKNGWQKNCD